MAGRIKRLIDEIIETRSKGNETIFYTTKAKITLKGIDPGKFDERSRDDPEVIKRLHEIATEMGVPLSSAPSA